MRRLIITGVVTLFALSLTAPAYALDKEKKEPVEAPPAAPQKVTPSTKQEAPRQAATQKRPESVDHFIDKDNDGVDDRRERKVVREPKPAKVKPPQKPPADPNRERNAAERQAPPR